MLEKIALEFVINIGTDGALAPLGSAILPSSIFYFTPVNHLKFNKRKLWHYDHPRDGKAASTLSAR